MNNDNDPNLSQVPVTPPVEPTTPVIPTPSAVPPMAQNITTEQPQQVDVSDGGRKKVRTIGKIMIALGVMAAISGVLADVGNVNMLLVVFAVAQILIGFGILAFNKVAYTLFNILAILAILSSLFVLPGIPLVFFAMLINPAPLDMLMAAIAILLNVAQLVFYIYGGIVFHKKEIRALFGKRQESTI